MSGFPPLEVEESLDYSRTLLLDIVKDTSKEAQIAELRGEDAQCIANLLSVLLHEDGAFGSEESQRLFRLLKILVKSSEVLPQCYKLQGIKCDFSRAQEGGTFADIFEGDYREQKVCIKAVRVFEKDDNTKVLKAIAKEAVLWAHLSHGNILPFYGVFLPSTPKRICIISPWMSKGDLSAFLKNSPNTPRFPLILDIVAGLRYLHASQIVHGDLKAKNILISDNGRALLADFGISRLIASTNSASSRISNGTLPWMAPELFDVGGECRPTLPSDVWSFGCVCYEVFTGNAPFYDYASTSKTLSALVQRTRRPADASQLDKTSIEERELMYNCWSYEPDNRPTCEKIYQSVVELMAGCEPARVENVALWKAIRSGSGMTINHERAHCLLHSIKECRGFPPSTLTRITELGDSDSPGPLSDNDLAEPSGQRCTKQSSFPVETRHKLQAMNISREDLRSKDMIIAVMGPTGVGKSNFIDVLTGQIDKRTGHLLESCTTEVQAIVIENYIGNGTNLVLVDTPGFDDTRKSDTEILSMISEWFEKTYRKKIKLTGILYLHRITDRRMGRTPLKNLHMFGKLCGDAAMCRVSMVTTMWDQVQDQQVAQDRELELKEIFWKNMLDLGSKMVRFENNPESAKAIVDGLVAEKRERETLLLQEELVDLKKRLNETHAGRMLYDALQKLVAEREASMKKLNAHQE